MTKSNTIKFAFTASLLISLTIYHLLNLFKPIENFVDLYKIVQIVVSGLIAYLVIYNQLLTKLIFGKNYIHGKYEGTSGIHRRGEKPDPSEGANKELISIKQTAFDTQISGRSYQSSTNSIVSSWEGRLYKVDGSTYYFATSLASEVVEQGIFQLSIDQKGNIDGFYYSGNPNRKAIYRISAKKVKYFALIEDSH